MIGRAPDLGGFNFQKSLTWVEKKLPFPVLNLKKIKAEREAHKQLLDKLFPKPVHLKRLILDIKHNYAKEIASIIGSIDFAEQRLAGLIFAIEELTTKIEKIEKVDEKILKELHEHIQQDKRIHESLEDLIFACTHHTMLQ
jgi:hypothetical protein